MSNETKMNATELRIGNLVNYYNENIIFEVIGIDKLGLIVKSLHTNEILIEDEETWIELDQFEPISLTEEWLFKFGFEKNAIDRETVIFNQINSTEKLQLFNGRIIYSILGVSQYEWSEAKILMVHQLQNLYFALTGKELKIIH
jgi:hypothetical protein